MSQTPTSDAVNRTLRNAAIEKACELNARLDAAKAQIAALERERDEAMRKYEGSLRVRAEIQATLLAADKAQESTMESMRGLRAQLAVAVEALERIAGMCVGNGDSLSNTQFCARDALAQIRGEKP